MTYSNPQKKNNICITKPLACSESSRNYYLYQSFSHYWTCLMLFVTCTYSKRSGLFLISLLNCRIYYTSLHTVFNYFYIAHSRVLHVEFLYIYKGHQETVKLQTQTPFPQPVQGGNLLSLFCLPFCIKCPNAECGVCAVPSPSRND